MKLVGNTQRFADWLKNQHGKKFDQKMFSGYKFFIECCFSNFFDWLESDTCLELKSDLLLNRAAGHVIFIEKIPLSSEAKASEKLIFMRNIYSYYKRIAKSKNPDQIQEAMDGFEKIILLFEKFFEENSIIDSEIRFSKEELDKLILISSLFLSFTQIINNGPEAHGSTLTEVWWHKDEKLKYFLYGYKYALQFAWLNVLGSAVFKKTQLKNLHQAKSWRNYKTYNTAPRNKDQLLRTFTEHFILSEQTCLDSYFYWVQKQIVTKLNKRYSCDITGISEVYKENKRNYNKNRFWKELLQLGGITDSWENLRVEDKLDVLLYWFPVEVIYSNHVHSHLGAAAFNTMLIGGVNMRSSIREVSKTLIAKFIHPYSNEGHNYSFGILIDTKAAVGHYSSGWLIFYNGWGDYSGSVREYEKTEALIKRFKKNNKIIVREMTIERKEFKDYLDQYRRGIDKKFETNLANILSEVKGTTLELFVFYLASTKYATDYSVQWGTSSNAGEMDILVSNTQKVILIECKTKPDNYDLKEENEKMKQKIQDRPESEKQIEFWFWYSPNKKNKKFLERNRITYHVLSTSSRSTLNLSKRTSERISRILNYETQYLPFN